MLSSIHPLGERARNNPWWLTVGAFTLASVTAGSMVGAALGLLGTVPVSGLSDTARLAAIAGIAIAAGLFDWKRVDPPGPGRQVNEHWIGYYRGWVYGGAFGAQLGLGVLTYIITWGVYATLAAEFIAGSWFGGAIIGAVFGFGRAIAPLTAVWIDRPSRLSAFLGQMSRLGPVMRSYGAVATMGIGVLGVVGAVL